MTHSITFVDRKFARSLLLGGALAIGVTGCNTTRTLNQQPVQPAQRSAPALEPAPLTPVQQGTLQPTTPAPPTAPAAPQPIPADPTPTPEPVQVAKAAPTSGKPVTRQALVGAWTVSSGGSNCQLFLALTKWSGGFRAAPRGCASTDIKDVAAWDVKGTQVVLVSTSGSQIATLFRSSDERFDGSTSNGNSISFSR